MRIIRKKKKAFTLIELVMVIIILGVLAAVAIPRFVDYGADADIAAEKGVVGGVRSGIMSAWLESSARPRTFPAALDGASTAACSTSNPCFNAVLQQGGITDDWSKTGATTYTGPTFATSAKTYTYDSSDGSFE